MREWNFPPFAASSTIGLDVRRHPLGAADVIDQESLEVAQQAEQIYRERLKDLLEPSHMHDFVAIEPQSGDYFLGKTLSEAMGACRETHPDRLAYAMRVGHRAAIHLGAVSP